MSVSDSSNSASDYADLVRQSAELKEAVADGLHWLSNHALQILVAAAVAMMLYAVMSLIKRVLSRQRRTDLDDNLPLWALISRTVARTTHLFMAITAVRLVVGYTHPPELVLQTVRFFFTIAAVLQVAIWAREFILGLIERKTGESGHGETLANAMGLIRVLVTFALFAIATIMVLDNLGVNVTGLVAGLGIGGIAIGLAAQGIFSDLFAALSIIFDRPFRQGDTVQYDATTATVERIGLKSTRLRSVGGEAKVISNANLLQKEITNLADIEVRRFAMPVSLIYQTPPEKALRVPDILKQVVEGAGAEFQRAGFSGFGPSSLDFELFFFVHGSDIDHAVAVRHAIGMAILTRFAKEELEFAYPTQTTFTAAPDGTMIYPFARQQDA